MPEHPLITLFILNWNRKDDLLNAIGSAKNQSYQPLEILIVDNGSTDGSAEAVIAAYSDLRLVQLDRNYGCPGGRNRGIAHARGDYIFFMDNDAFLHRRAVEIAYETMKKDERIGVVNGQVKFFSDPKEVDVDCSLPDPSDVHYAVSFHGGVSLHRKSMYGDVGVYPDDYMYGSEEWNLGLRMIEKGYFVVTNPAVVLWHAKADTARDRTEELVRRQVNSLANRMSLWPGELALIYGAKTLFKHPYQALKYGVFDTWIQRWPGAWLQGFQRGVNKREPLSRTTIKRYNAIKFNHLSSRDDALRPTMNYAECILSEVFNRH